MASWPAWGGPQGNREDWVLLVCLSPSISRKCGVGNREGRSLLGWPLSW